jgi:hypothetical protein
MPLGKCFSGSALQVPFEAACFPLIGEREIADKTPWPAMN